MIANGKKGYYLGYYDYVRQEQMETFRNNTTFNWRYGVIYTRVMDRTMPYARYEWRSSYERRY